MSVSVPVPIHHHTGCGNPVSLARAPDVVAIEAFTNLLEERDPEIGEHCSRVAECAKQLAVRLGLSGSETEDVYWAAKLHDIGKISLPDSVLKHGPGKLTSEEWELVHRHPISSAELLSMISGFAKLAPIVRAHHERYDGGGYPDGLRGNEIPFKARIVTVADAFDAMTSVRTYCAAMTVEDALGQLRQQAGTQFDPCVVTALEEIYAEEVLLLF